MNEPKEKPSVSNQDPSQCGCGSVNEGTAIRVAVITLSDTRTIAEDRSGDAILAALAEGGHHVVQRLVMTDDADPLEQTIGRLARDEGVDAIITTGGTGLAHRDLAVDVIERCLDVDLPGFGEHFRRVSFDEIGAKAMLSRATAGRIGRVVVFALPGSSGAVKTAMGQCVLPILRHVVSLAQP